MISPRKKTSKKRTEIPTELIEQIEDLLLANFRPQLKRRVPVVSGYIYPEEIVIGVGLQVPKQLKQPRFDISVDYNPSKDNATKMIHLCVDVLAGLFEKLVLEEDDQEFPLLWEGLEFEKKKVFVQYGTANIDLETKANELLGETAETLVQFEDEDEAYEDPETLKARLGFKDDDDGGDSTH